MLNSPLTLELGPKVILVGDAVPVIKRNFTPELRAESVNSNCVVVAKLLGFAGDELSNFDNFLQRESRLGRDPTRHRRGSSFRRVRRDSRKFEDLLGITLRWCLHAQLGRQCFNPLLTCCGRGHMRTLPVAI